MLRKRDPHISHASGDSVRIDGREQRGVCLLCSQRQGVARPVRELQCCHGPPQLNHGSIQVALCLLGSRLAAALPSRRAVLEPSAGWPTKVNSHTSSTCRRQEYGCSAIPMTVSGTVARICSHSGNRKETSDQVRSHSIECATTSIAACTHGGMTVWLPTPTADKVSCNAATVLMW